MAATAIALQFRANKTRPIRNPSYVHLFSSSTSDPNVDDQNTTTTSSSPSETRSSFSSYFSDVKASLKQQSTQPPPRKPFSFSSTDFLSTEKPPSKIASLEEIRKNLSEYRRRSAAPLPGDKSSSQPTPSQRISFEDLYKKNVISKGEEQSNESTEGAKLTFEAIRKGLGLMRSKNQAQGVSKPNDPLSLSKFKGSLKLRPMDPNIMGSPVVIGGTDGLPANVFGKEIRDKRSEEPAAMTTEFVKMYSYEELGEKLRMLRPEAKVEKWFSLGELNERLVKLREIEEREAESTTSIGVTFKDLRDSLKSLQRSSVEEKARKPSIHRLDFLSQLGKTPNYMSAPPKENLVEMFFHPDNMSSSEKMKLELKKVRDEFKMSESDCGSARVQVAQLTTKIKHLSTALHKKDKHSRKGLQEMVQRRKKLLKYLRRTDWDSYCLVLSKLGLRDNPDYKN